MEASGRAATAHSAVLRGSAVSCLRSGRELPGSQVTSLFEDRAGRLWVGLDDGLWVYEHERFSQVRRPDGRPIGLVTSITEDTEEQIWIAVSGPPRILMRIEGLTVRQEYHDAPLPRRVAADPTGGLWLGLLAGDLARLHDGRLQTFRFAPDDTGLLHQVVPLTDGSVLAATSYGLIGWLAGRQATLTVKNGLPCDAVHAIVFDGQDDLWLFLSCGLTEVTSADLQRWKNDPGAQISPRTLDELDGVRMGRAAFAAAARSTDGRLWFANGVQLQTTDPARLRRNAVPPPVHIERIVADRTSYPAGAAVRLPPLTRDLEVDYVGLSFVAPQKVRFRYRLEGRDDTWQEPGTRRQAFYSDLRPGHVSLPRDRQQQRRRVERRRRIARLRHRSRLVSDDLVPGALAGHRWLRGVGGVPAPAAPGGGGPQCPLRRATGGTDPGRARPARYLAADGPGHQDGGR